MRRCVPNTTFVLIGLLTLCAVGPVLAQEDFSGQWKLDTGRSDPLQRGGQALPEADMTVQMKGDDVAIDIVYKRDGQERPLSYVYQTDGEPHDIPTVFGRDRSVRVKWKKNKLVASYTFSMGRGGGFEADVVETWSLSKDKSELEVSYASRVNERSMIRKEIYTRASS